MRTGSGRGDIKGREAEFQRWPAPAHREIALRTNDVTNFDPPA